MKNKNNFSIISLMLIVSVLIMCCNPAETTVNEITSKVNSKTKMGTLNITEIKVPYYGSFRYSDTMPLDTLNKQWHYTSLLHLDTLFSKIEWAVNDYYFNDCMGDSSESEFTRQETYITTIDYGNRAYRLFMVLLKHPIHQTLSCKLMLYDRAKNSFSSQLFDHQIHATYELDNQTIKRSGLIQKLNRNFPDIQMEGANRFILKRLYHNGTANAIETIKIEFSTLSIDTLYFHREWIQN